MLESITNGRYCAALDINDTIAFQPDGKMQTYPTIQPCSDSENLRAHRKRRGSTRLRHCKHFGMPIDGSIKLSAAQAHKICMHERVRERCTREGLQNQRVQGINRSLQLNWERLPAEQALVTSIGPPDDASRRLILVTATYPHTLQPLKLRNCARMLAPEPNVLWIVVEDSASPSPAIAALLNGSAA